MAKKNTANRLTSGLARSLEAAVVLAKATACGAGRWQATKFRHGRLTLVAPSPIAAQELTLRASEVLDALNALFGQPLIKQLLIRS